MGSNAPFDPIATQRLPARIGAWGVEKVPPYDSSLPLLSLCRLSPILPYRDIRRSAVSAGAKAATATKAAFSSITAVRCGAGKPIPAPKARPATARQRWRPAALMSRKLGAGSNPSRQDTPYDACPSMRMPAALSRPLICYPRLKTLPCADNWQQYGVRAETLTK